MNLIQAIKILNEHRPEKPRSLETKKLQQAIDTVNDYIKYIPWSRCYRCEECEYHRMVKSKLHPYQAEHIRYCNYNNVELPEANMTSCDNFIPKEDNNEKTN